MAPLMPARSIDGAAAEASHDGSFSRARLLPYNRRLRHLHGLSLRNLNLASLADHAKKQTPKTPSGSGNSSSEAAINTDNSFKASPEKLSPGDASTDAVDRKATDDATRYMAERPSLKKSAKRRSTLNWAGISPQARQKKLENVTASRMADTWFSLHCEGIEEPVYVSEIVPLAMNPNYRFFDLDSAGCLFTRLAEMTIKIWAKTESMSEYELIIDLPLHLPSLRYIGKTLDDQETPLPQNSLLLHMSDGVYTNVAHLRQQKSPPPALLQALSAKPSPDARPTSSYDALMQLSSLDDCIQDALMTQERIAVQINQILSRTAKTANGDDSISESNPENGTAFDHQTLHTSTAESLASTRRYLAAENKQLRLRTKVRANLLESLRSRREAIARGQRAQKDSDERLKAAKLGLRDYEISMREQDSNIRNQRRRLCEDLTSIYPVEPIPQHPMEFTIRAIPLPNSSALDEDPHSTAAALGYISHVIHLLSSYLCVPFSYPVHPQLSTSLVHDPISIMPHDQRTFPLYPKNSIQYRFEYGVFLLNKDIECLMSRLGLKVLDLRHTLPNLKYLLYVLSAQAGGRDDAASIPARIVAGAGGGGGGAIKALLAAANRKRSPLGPSRMQSHDSMDGSVTDGTRGVGERGPKPGLLVTANGGGPKKDAKTAVAATTIQSLAATAMKGMSDDQPPLTFSFRARAAKSRDRSLMATEWT